MDTEDEDALPLMASLSSSFSGDSTSSEHERGVLRLARRAGTLMTLAGIGLVTISGAGAWNSTGRDGLDSDDGGIGKYTPQPEQPLEEYRHSHSQHHSHSHSNPALEDGRDGVKPMAMPTSWIEGAPAKCKTIWRLDEFAKWAHSWCYPRHGANIPKKLQGLFWLKDMKLEDVAVCLSLGTWDSHKRVLTLEVATSFVFKNSWAGDRLAQSIGSVGMYYEFQFSDAGLTYADITPHGRGIGKINMALMNAVTKFPLKEEASSHGSGDFWVRPSYFEGIHTDTYYVWRILDSNFNVEWSRVRKMEEQIRQQWQGTLIRYHDDGCHRL